MSYYASSPLPNNLASVPALFNAFGIGPAAEQQKAQTKLVNTEADSKQFDLNNAKSLFQGLHDHDVNGFGYSQPFENLSPDQQSNYLNTIYSNGFKGDPTQAIQGYRSMYEARSLPSTRQMFNSVINGGTSGVTPTSPTFGGAPGTLPNLPNIPQTTQPASTATQDSPFSPHPSFRYGAIPKIGANGQPSIEMEKLIGPFSPPQTKYLDTQFDKGNMNAWADFDKELQEPAQKYVQAKIDEKNRLVDHVQKFNTLVQDNPDITSYVGGGKSGEGFLAPYRDVQSIWNAHVGKDGRFDPSKPLNQQESLAVAYRIARLDNPGAIAREGTLEQMMAGSSKWDSMKAASQNALSGQSKIPPEVVQDMVDVMNKYKQAKQPAFEASLALKEPLMAKFGVSPEDVIGDAQALSDYRRTHPSTTPGSAAAASSPAAAAQAAQGPGTGTAGNDLPVAHSAQEEAEFQKKKISYQDETGKRFIIKGAGTPSNIDGTAASSGAQTPIFDPYGTPDTRIDPNNPRTSRPLRTTPQPVKKVPMTKTIKPSTALPQPTVAEVLASLKSLNSTKSRLPEVKTRPNVFVPGR